MGHASRGFLLKTPIDDPELLLLQFDVANAAVYR
jgi:hypothetical protein